MLTWSICMDLIRGNDYIQLQKKVEREPDLIYKMDSVGRSLLVKSILFGSFECMAVFITCGADINKEDVDGDTALTTAVYSNEFKATQLLLDCGADLSIRNDYGQSAFDFVTMKGEKDIPAWIELFSLHKDRLDQKDLALYHEIRLQALFA
jgi:ankyrin repeat protein